MFFYVYKVLFLGFLQFNGNFVDAQNNSKCRDWAPLTLVTLPSFNISGETSAEKMYVENWKIYRHLYDWGYALYPQSYKRHCKFNNFQLTFSQLLFHLKCWNFAGLLKLWCSF